MAYPTNVLLGDRVRWESAEGTKRGEVMQIFEAQDYYGDYINFYHVAYSDGFDGTTMIMISEDQLEDLEFKVIFRDYDIQADQAEYEQMAEA